MKNKKLWSIIIAVSVFVVVLTLDLLTKEFIISKYIPQEGDSHDVIPGFFNLLHVRNQGAGWGVLSGKPILLIIMSAIILILFVVFYALRVRMVGNRSSIWFAISVGLIAGGCLGNMIDRFVFAEVRDFINLQFISFPTFNIADVAICVGIVTVIIYFLFFYSKEEKGSKKDEEGK